MLLVLAALHLIVLHSLDGGTVVVNSDQVTSLRSPRPKQNLTHDAANCVVGLTDGKLVSVTESCDTVRQMLEGGP